MSTVDHLPVHKWFDPDRVRRVGQTPDYRFSLANERTFLAWVRTGLALVAGGLAVVQFLPELALAHLREVLAVRLLLLGGLVGLRALNHWLRCERAMRLGEDLPPSRFPALLALVVAAGVLLLVAVTVGPGDHGVSGDGVARGPPATRAGSRSGPGWRGGGPCWR